MKSPRVVAYLVLIYSGILAVSLLVLSIMSLTAYGCGFDFKTSSVTYMMYLIYYRAARCHTNINWSILDGINQEITIQPDMPTETDAVFRTLMFAMVYLILSIFLVITSILSLTGLRRTGKSKHLIFWLYFVPFIIVFVSVIIMDLIASGFYLFEYFSLLGVNGLIRILEIRNPNEIRPILEQISLSTRSLPSMILFAATSKCIFLLVLNIFIVFKLSPAVWQICEENSKIMKYIHKTEAPQEPVAMISGSAHDVNVTVTNVEPVESRDESTLNTQPPFNPYMTGPRKEETHF